MKNRRLSSYFQFALLVLVLSFAFASSLNAETAALNPPQMHFENEPNLYIIPGTYIYYFNSNNSDFYFSDGYWWRYWNMRWYRASIYTGPWSYMERRYISQPLQRLPARWRYEYSYAERVKWNEVRNHHREWERNRYWNKRGWIRNDVNARYDNDRENLQNDRYNIYGRNRQNGEYRNNQRDNQTIRQDRKTIVTYPENRNQKERRNDAYMDKNRNDKQRTHRDSRQWDD